MYHIGGIYTYMCIYVYICVYIYDIYVYICVYIYMVYMYTHTHTHTQNGVLLSHKEEWNFAIYNDIDGAREYYAKQNKSVEKDKYHMISLIYET